MHWHKSNWNVTNRFGYSKKQTVTKQKSYYQLTTAFYNMSYYGNRMDGPG